MQLSGGIADDASLERALATGCARVNLSTAALGDPEWVARAIAEHGERVAVGLDVRIVHGDHASSARGGRATAATSGRPSPGSNATAPPATSSPT